MLNKKFNNRKSDICFKNHDLTIEVDEGNHDSDDEKEREGMFKNHNFQTFQCNPNEPQFDLFRFVGEINLYISKLREKKATTKVINKIAEDFENVVAFTKSKELKQWAKNVLPNYKKRKSTQVRNKPIKIGKRSGTTYCFGCKNLTHNFRPQEVKMTNKVLREKPNCVVCWSNKSRFLKKTQQQKIIQRFTD